jgi:hypothetical protein
MSTLRDYRYFWARSTIGVLEWVGLVVTIDLTDYALTPIDRLLGMLAWMVEKG